MLENIGSSSEIFYKVGKYMTKVREIVILKVYGLKYP